MPIHEYRCSTCQAVTEDWRHLSSEAKRMVPCGNCGLPAPKIVSVPRIHFTEYQRDPDTGMDLPVHKGSVWEDTPLEEDDLFGKGINPLTYKSKKVFVNL